MSNSIKFVFFGNLFLILFIVFFTLFYPYIGTDGGYYLAIGRDYFQDGINLYTIANGYNPLGILIYSFPYLFAENPYFFSVLILILIHFSNSVLFYLILNKTQVERKLKFFVTSVFLLYSFLLDGTLIILEPIQLFFAFISILFLLNKNLFFAGFFVFLSFYSKQYSLVLLPAFLFFLLKAEDNVKKITFLFLGFFFGIGLVFLFFAQGCSVDYFLMRLIGKDSFLPSSMNSTGVGYSFVVFAKNSLNIAKFFPLVFLWLAFFNWKKICHEKLFFIVLFFSFCLVFYFAAYMHYYLLPMPWALVLFIHFYEKSNKKINELIFSFFVLFSFIMSGLYTYKVIKNRIISFDNETELSVFLNSKIEKNSSVFLDGVSISQYVYSEYKSANHKLIGYTFPNCLPGKYFMDNIKKGSYIIKGKSPDVYNQLVFNKVYQDDSITILKKNI